MDNVVIYARVSSKEQEAEGYSIPAQLKLLQEYASKNGYTIVKEFTDVETAKKAGRTQFSAMLSYIETNINVKHVLVEKTDRLLRNMVDFVSIERLMNEFGVTIHLVKESEKLNRDSVSNAKFIFGIKASPGKIYSPTPILFAVGSVDVPLLLRYRKISIFIIIAPGTRGIVNSRIFGRKLLSVSLKCYWKTFIFQKICKR